MIRDNLHEPFELVLREYMDECPRGEHAHSFFELVYIVDGTGRHRINATELEYRAGDLFLLAPNDSHTIFVGTPTQLFFIRLNPAFIQSAKKEKELIQRLEMILQSAGQAPGSVVESEPDRKMVASLMEAIMRERDSAELFHKELIGQLINSLLVLIARNLSRRYPATIGESSEERSLQILQWIQSNIYYPEKLRAEVISAAFGISETYLGRYFKKQTNETLQQYILNYKLRLIENRLLHSNMRINEIADEFGFTDKSHLNRIFKKYKGMNPTEFRRAH